MTSLTEHLHRHATAQPDAIALIHDRGAGGTLTTSYASLDRLAHSFSCAVQRNFPQASLIPMLLGKSVQCVGAMLGAMEAGKAFACLNRKLRGPQLMHMFELMKPDLALIDPPGLTALREAIGSNAGRKAAWWLVADGELSPAHGKIIEELHRSFRIESLNLADFDESPAIHLESRDSLQAATCLFTSGSTGTPKGVVVSQKDLLHRAVAEAGWFGLTNNDVLLSILPFSFDVGLNQLLAAMISGCSVVLLDSWLPADILKACAQYKVTGISAVPTIWQDMMAAGMKFDTTNTHRSLRYLTLSGGDMTIAQLEKLPDLAPGVGIFKTYGQTEAFRATSLRPDEFANKKQSVGRPFANAKIYVIRADGTQCLANEEGEIIHAGLGVMSGYLDGHDPQHKLTPNPFVCESDPSPMAVFTGDLGYFDSDGYLYVTGRRDAMLKISGNRVYPKEILEQLLSLPGISAGEVIGTKDANGNCRIVAFAVVRLDAAASPDQIRRQLITRLPSYMVPHEVIFVKDLPKTASGKIDHPGLLELAAAS